MSLPSRDNWREILDHYCIRDWTNCIRHLEESDVVAVTDGTNTRNLVTSGNYFWARGDYINKLPKPTDSNLYLPEPELWPTGHAYRYCFERWILCGNPKIHWTVDTKTNHYDNYLFLEDLLANNPATV